MRLTRAALESCVLQTWVAQSGLDLTVWSDAEHEASIQALLQQQRPEDPVYVFAYGSLIWNPCCHYVDCVPAMLYGWHRDFCLWAPVGRGTPEQPGLVLGLERGGSCHGLVFRLSTAHALADLRLMWRREMVVGSYIPRWVSVRCGEGFCQAIAFTVNPHHACYTGKLQPEQLIRTLATAEGELGSSADYLRQTVEGLRQNGLCDHRLQRLQQRVEQWHLDQSAA